TAPSGTKLVFYQAAAPTGWTTDVAVADAVIAVKGGSNAYDDTAGTLVGTWTQPNHTHTITHTHETDHTHTVTMDAHNHKMQDYISGTTWKFFKSDGTSDTASGFGYSISATSGAIAMGVSSGNPQSYQGDFWVSQETTTGTVGAPNDATTDSQSAADTGNGATAATYRPYAALSIVATKD
ncbi:MAG: hypothetical protein ACYS32_00640, partial [Planctomycetota bacterium]